MDEESELLHCAVCLDAFEDPRFLSCCHTFCLKCIEPLVSIGRMNCPICRQETKVLLGAAKLTKNFYVEKTKMALQKKDTKLALQKKDTKMTLQKKGNRGNRSGNQKNRFQNQNQEEQMLHRDQPSVELHNRKVRVYSSKTIALMLSVSLGGILYLLQFEITRTVFSFCAEMIMIITLSLYNLCLYLLQETQTLVSASPPYIAYIMRVTLDLLNTVFLFLLEFNSLCVETTLSVSVTLYSEVLGPAAGYCLETMWALVTASTPYIKHVISVTLDLLGMVLPS